MQRHPSILLLDDSPGECELFRLALAHTGVDTLLYSHQDPEAALRFLRHQTVLPALTLLDWRLQNQSGEGFLRLLKQEARFATLPVVVFTTSDDAGDMTTAYAAGANGYVVKPGTFDELVQCVGDLCRYWMHRNRVPDLVTSQC